MVRKGAKGRGAKLTFLSNDTQNNAINIIGKEISSEIVKEIGNCRAWALIADTTPDIRHHEQLSICANYIMRKIVHREIKLIVREKKC